MSKDSEDETPDSAKIEKNDKEKNEDSESRSSSPYNFEDKVSEYDQSATDVEDKNKFQASGTVRNTNGWSKELRFYSRK